MSGTMNVNQDMSLNGNLDVQGTSSFFNRLNVISNNGIYTSGNVVANDLTAMGRAFVNNQLFLYQDVTTSASIECKNLTVNGFFTANFQDGVIPVTAITNHHIMTSTGELQQGVNITNDANLNNRLFVKEAITASEGLLLGNDAVLANRMFVTGDVSFNRRVYVLEDATISKRLFAVGDSSFGGDLHVTGKLTGASFDDNSIPVAAIDGDILTGSDFSNDVIGQKRLFVLGDSSLNKLTVSDDATINKRIFAVGDASFSGNITTAKHLNVAGTLTAANYADESIPQSAIIGGITQSSFSSDVTMAETLKVAKDITTEKRLFVEGDTNLSGRTFAAGDVSLNNKLYVNNNLTVGGTLTVNSFGVGTIPQSAINGGVGITSSNFTEDMTTSKRLFVTGDSSMNKATIEKDATINGRLFANGEPTFKENITAEKNLVVGGNLTANYTAGSIPQTAIDGGVGLTNTQFTSDTSTTKRLFVAGDTSMNKVTIEGDATINGKIFANDESTFAENVTASKGLTVTGTITAGGYADNTIPASAIIGGVGSSDSTFSTDVVTSKRMFVTGDASFNRRLYVLQDATISKRLFANGDVSFTQNVGMAKDLNVTGKLTVGDFGTATIPMSALDGSVGLQDTNFDTTDVLVGKRLYVTGDASFNRTYIEQDATITKRLFANGETTLAGDVTMSNNVTINGGGVTQVSTPLTVTGLTTVNDLTINGTLTATHATDSIPKAAVVGLVGPDGSKFTEDISTTKRLFVTDDTTLSKRLFMSDEMTVGSNISLTGSTGKAIIQDLSINQNASVKGDLHVDGNFVATFADGSIPRSALEADAASGTIAVDLSANKRAFIDGDVTMRKRLFVANDLSLGGNIFMGTATTAKLTVQDISVNDDVSVKGDLHVDGNLIANFADESIPQSALQAGAASGTITIDLSANKRAFIDDDVTMRKRLFIANDLSLGGDIFMGSANSKLTVQDISVNDDLSVTGDLHVGGKFLVSGYEDNSIPQSAIIGGVGSNVFTEDLSANQRAFVDGDVTLRKRLFVANDLSLGGSIFLGSGSSKVVTQEISAQIINTNDLHVDGAFSANNFPDNTIPQSAIIGGVGSNVITEDLSANQRAFVDGDVTLNKRLFVASDLSLGGNIFMGTAATAKLTAQDLSINDDLSVKGVLHVDGALIANYPDGSIPSSAVAADATAGTFTVDISANQNINVDGDATFNKGLVIASDLSLGGKIFMGGAAGALEVRDVSINNDLTVTGNIFGNYPSETIPQSAIIGGVGSNVVTEDLFAQKRAFVDEDATLKKRLFIANDLSNAGKLFMTTSQIQVKDISVNNDVTVAGNLFATYPSESIPQSAIIGGVGSNVITDDLVAQKRAFVDEDATVRQRLFVSNDLSMGGSIFMGQPNARIETTDLSLAGDLTVDKNVIIKGALNVEQYTNSAIINTTTTNYELIVSQDLSLNGNLSVSNDAEVTNRVFIGPSQATYVGVSKSSTTEKNQIGFFTNDTERVRIGSDGTVLLGTGLTANPTGTLLAAIVSGTQVDSTTSNIETANITSIANVADLTVTGTITLPAASIPAEAILGEVSSSSSATPSFLVDVSMNKRLLVGTDLSMGGDLTVVGDASVNNTLQTKDLVVTGTTTFAAASIKSEAIDGNVGVDFTNDVSMNKRLFIESDLSMGGNLVVLSDASVNGAIVGNSVKAVDLVVTGSTTFPTASINGSAIAGTVGADYGIDIHMEKRLFVDSDVSFGGHFLVVNDTSLNGDVDVGGTINGNLKGNVTGNVTGSAATVSENTQTGITTLPSLASIGAAGATLLAEGNLQATNLLASSDAYINGMISVIGDINVNSGKFVVSGANGNTTVAGSLNVTAAGGINNSGATVLASTLAVSGETTLSNNVSVVGGTLGVSGVTTLSDAATVGGTLGVTGASTFGGNLTLNATDFAIGVAAQPATINATTPGNLTIKVPSMTNNALRVIDADSNELFGVKSNNTASEMNIQTVKTNVSGTLDVTGDTKINTDKFVITAATGNTAIAGTLDVTGDTTINTDKFVVTAASGNTAIAGTLGVTGASTFNDNVSVADTKTFTVGTGASSLGGTLAVTGESTFNNNLFVKSGGTNTVTITQSNGNFKNTGYLWTDSQLIVGDTDKFTVLGTNGNTEIGGDLKINTDKFVVTAASGNTAIAGGLDVTGDAKVNTDKFVVTAASGNTAIAGTIGVTGASTLSSTLDVTGDTKINTDKFVVTAASGNTAIAGTLDVTADTKINTDKFVVTAASGNTAIAGTLDVTADTKINTDKFVVTAASGNTAIAGTLDVTADTKINTDKFVVTAASGNTAIAGTLDVTGNAVLNGDLSLNERLYVGKNAVFDKDVTIEGNLSVQQYQNENIINTTTTNYNLIISEDISLNGRLFVDYDASLNGNLFVEKKSILHDDVSMNNHLFVGNDASFNSNVYIAGDFNAASSISFDKDISINGINIGRGSGNSATNTAIGKDALSVNSTGTKNTAFGVNTLIKNTTGISNTAVGDKALADNASGNYNTAVGADALNLTTGEYNTSFGYQALKNNTTGTSNTAIGRDAGLNSKVGTSNTYVGHGADDDSADNNYSQSTAIGYNAKITGDKQIIIGGDATTGKIFLNASDISGNPGTLNVKMISFPAESIPANAIEGSSSSTTSLTGAVIMNSTLRVDGSANFQEDVAITGATNLGGRFYVAGRVDADSDASFNANVQMAGINGMVSFVTTGTIEIAGAISNTSILDDANYTAYVEKTLATDFDADVIRASSTGQYVFAYDDASGNYGYMSRDYGATFTSVSLGTTGSGVTNASHDINKRVSMSSDGQYIMVVGNNYICFSKNYGVSFSTALSNSSLTYTCCSTTGQYSIVGTNEDKLYISTDFGATIPAHSQSPVNTGGSDGSGGSGELHAWKFVAINSTGRYIVAMSDEKVYTYNNSTSSYTTSTQFTDSTSTAIPSNPSTAIGAIHSVHMTQDGNYVFIDQNAIIYRLSGPTMHNTEWFSVANRKLAGSSGERWEFSSTTLTGMDGKYFYAIDKTNNGKVVASADSGNTIGDDPKHAAAARAYQAIAVSGNGAYTYAATADKLYVKEYKDGTTASVVTGEAFILSQDASFNNRIFVDHDVSFNKRLFVGENSILTGDVSMNSTMNINGDVSMNSRLYVKKSIHSNLFMESTEGDVTEMDVRVVDKTAQHRHYNDGSSKGYLVNEGESPYLMFVPGKSYRFLQDDSTNSTHQIKFYLSPNKVDVDGNSSLYENGVTYNGTAGSAGAYTQIDVSMGTPSVLYYQCVNHGLMGNQVNVLGSKSFDGDLSYNVIKLPSGTTNMRPTSIERGVVRYNTTTDQFEGYGAGDAWGSLGGVIDVDQDTYIKAETAANDDNDQLQFFTAGTQRMIIGNNGDISMNHDLKLNSDSGKITLGLDDDVIIKHDGTDGLDIDSAGALSLNSSAGAINLGDDAVTGAINIGSGASARTITVGNDASTKVDVNALAIELDAGTGGLNLLSDETGNTSILMRSYAGGILMKVADESRLRMGGEDEGAYYEVVTSATAADEKVTIKNSHGTAADAIKLQATSGGIDIDSGTTMAIDAGSTMTLTSTDALTLTDGTSTLSLGGTGETSISGATTLSLDSTGNLAINSSAGTIGIGDDANTGAINIGTGAAARDMVIGNKTGATDLILRAGTGGILLDSTGKVEFLTTSDTANAYQVIATGGTSSTVRFYNQNGTSTNSIEFQSDAGGIKFGGTTYDVDSTDAVTIDTTDTTNGIKLGTSTSAVPITIGHTTSEVTVADNLTVTGELSTTGNNSSLGGTNLALGQSGQPFTINMDSNSAAALTIRVQNNAANSFIVKSSAGDFINLSTGTSDSDLKISSVTTTVAGTKGLIVDEDATISKRLFVTGAIDANSTADIADTLTLSKASGTGLAVTSDATIGGNLTITGDFTVNGAATTISTTNTTISDSLMELSSGAASAANDAGFIIERGSTGDNAFMGWDESEDKFVLGTTTATGASTGDLTITEGKLKVSELEGTIKTAAQNDITTMTGLTAIGTSGTYTVFAGDASFNEGLSVLEDASFNKGIYMYGDVSWNPSNIAADSIPSNAIIGGVGSSDFTTDVSMNEELFVAKDLSLNQRIFIGGDISMNMGTFIQQF
jgi:hydroxyacyl-ACP dehydratase HTD2-like protein with hotdog domain